ncbi:phosphoethanolamine transferase [Campylobacter mucosalis]|uniref:phosphoethanolamine transferase n=1 Tax=Campylobacter mucosalis TaxID=202 RepID=UPI00146FEF2D|nr:phosphoethanolamine transferase [Campylobacter mucosalis]
MRKFLITILKPPILNIFLLTLFTVYLSSVYKIYFFEGADRIAIMHMFRSFSTIFLLNFIIFHILYLLSFRFFDFVLKIYAVLVFVFVFVDIFLLINLKTTINIELLDAIFHTNFKETTEFFAEFFDIKFIFFILLCAFLSIFFVTRKWGGVWLEFSKRSVIIISVIYAVFTASFVISSIKHIKNNKIHRITNKVSEHVVIEFGLVLNEYFKDDNLVANLRKIEQGYDKAKVQNFGIQANNKIKNVVLIIGESLHRDFMQIYGFNLNTTPNLKTLFDEQKMIIFTDTVAPATATNPSLQRVLNFSNYESKQNWFDSLNIVDMFDLVGYETAWISNQGGGVFSSVAKSVSLRVKEQFFTNEYSQAINFEGQAYDGELLPEILKFKNSNEKLKFYAIHLMGSHFKYEQRYPKDFTKFTIKDVPSNLKDEQKQAVVHYLNSVFYNDFVVDEIYKIFKDDEAIIIYLSDHGETMFRQKDVRAHGVLNRFVLEIPLIFIATDEFKANHADIWQKLNEAKNLAFMSDDLIHVIADIIGVKPLEYDAKKSLISGEFNASRARIINGVNYESLKNEKPFW